MGIAGNIANVLQRSMELKGAAQPGDSFTEPTVTAQDATNAAKLGPLGYVASPTTAWVSGQSIRVSGFRFYWNGTAWAARPAGQQEDQEPTAYDPGDHTVDEVKAYLGGITDPAEWHRIHDVEATGKNRVTLLTWIDENHP